MAHPSEILSTEGASSAMGDDTQLSTGLDGTKTSSSLTLMSLPTEIRYKIWTEVLGCRTIHLDYQFQPPSSTRMVSYPEKWSHYVCLSLMSENDIHQRFLCKPTEHDPYRQHGHLDYEDCEYHHEECRSPDILYQDMERVYLSLGLLRVNKTIHAEADHALLTTNLFSIESETCFEAFFARLSPERTALIAKLHLSLTWTNAHDENRLPINGLNAWNAYMTPELVSQLTGLRTLHVCMAQAFYYHTYLKTMKEMDLEWVGGICNFKVLGKKLKTLTASLTDVKWSKYQFAYTEPRESIEAQYRWTVKEKQDFCERLRRKILA